MSIPRGAADRAPPPPGPPPTGPRRIERFVPNPEHNPNELKSWARRTGFRPSAVSGETLPDDDSLPPPPPPPPPPTDGPTMEELEAALDLEQGLGRRRRAARVKMEEITRRRKEPEPRDAIEEEQRPEQQSQRRRGGADQEPAAAVRDWDDVWEAEEKEKEALRNGRAGGIRGEPSAAVALEVENGIGRRCRRWVGMEPAFLSRRKELRDQFEVDEAARREEVECHVPVAGRNLRDTCKVDVTAVNVRANGEATSGHVESPPPPLPRPPALGSDANGAGKKEAVEIGGFQLSDDHPQPQEEEEPSPAGQPWSLRVGIADHPGWVALFFCGLQQYFSIAGSLVLAPLLMVPAMGGTGEDTATVISTVLLVSGVTTILHTCFGSRLPLIQGSSFVYLAPALVIANSVEFRNLSQNRFKHTMRELQGAIIIGSIFQAILGYTGLMSLLLRLINPVVIAPTIAAVGLAFFSFGFPQAGSCIEISMPSIVLVLIFTLYMRKISLFHNRIFLIYAVPLSVAIIWAYAFFLTAGGAYNFKGCSSNVPTSNILLDSCRTRVEAMRRCRTDVSDAWRTSAWIRVPYPFQWGLPAFHIQTSFIMVFVSLVASVDSVASYHATALLAELRPPTTGVVSRAIGLEGITSVLAAVWGTGTGSTTLTENVHIIGATKVANRRALQLGGVFLILVSVFGKVGALLASIPLALAAAALCFNWALTLALGLSTLRYTQAASSRNAIIVGFTLFISMSIPAYFQQYDQSLSFILPSYLLPFSAASSGPVRTGIQGLNYAVNAVLSISSVVALTVAFILDNTVPGSKEERGVYIWSNASSQDVDPASLEPYRLPEKIRCWFSWAKCVGL